jgi:DNA-binding transcriptional ArsR family regulator
MDKKQYKDLERILKGVASHRRIQILDILNKQSELSVFDVAENISIDFRTTSEHLRKLALAGLVMKRNEGATVRHALSERGKVILKFCRTLV